MSVYRATYCSRSDVMSAPDIKFTADMIRHVDSAIQAAADDVEELCHRRFWNAVETGYFDWPLGELPAFLPLADLAGRLRGRRQGRHRLPGHRTRGQGRRPVLQPHDDPVRRPVLAAPQLRAAVGRRGGQPVQHLLIRRRGHAAAGRLGPGRARLLDEDPPGRALLLGLRVRRVGNAHIVGE